MKKREKEMYSRPELRVLKINFKQALLLMSDANVSLTGAGVDEGNAEENGENIW